MTPFRKPFGLVPFILLVFFNMAQSQSNWDLYGVGGLTNSTILKNGNNKGSALTNPFARLEGTSPSLMEKGESRTINNLRLGMDLGYTIKGSDFNIPSYKHQFHYAHLTFKPTFKILDAFNGYTGGRISYLITDFKKGTNNLSEEKMLIGSPEKWNISGIIGFETKLSNKLRLDLNYQYGLTGIEDAFHHSAFQVGFEYRLSNARKDKLDTVTRESNQKAVEARNHIRQLKKGMLLVRLKSRQTKIQSLKDEGRPGKARTVKRKTDSLNRKIREAFQKHFHFCSFRFFYNHDTEMVQKGNWKNSVFDADSNYVSPQLAQKNNKFYIADIGETFLSNSKQMFDGVVVRDSSLNILEDPFPNKIISWRSLYFLGLNRDPKDMVKKLDQQLRAFYK